jgi:hypothetical protein
VPRNAARRTVHIATRLRSSVIGTMSSRLKSANATEDMKPFLVVCLIFAVIYVAAYAVEMRNDKRCSEKCMNAGAKSYQYKGISGYYRHLEPGACTCIS